MYVTAVWRRVLHWSTRARLPSPLPGPAASPQEAADRFAAAVVLLSAGWAAAHRACRPAGSGACGCAAAPGSRHLSRPEG
ncbi:hypothetical protein CHLRE_09g386751v5 [Chlamydomonas reinhardtii]|uniref:Uncharacterized protein n=1 Tax=Chlamydomonas reinhardtii TaxID=3055 RepID=A0A2K3DCH5_CHLRE|nr:uncharacterized protein CHLRE_09g386751v5 [Chlamydomonas reinhardtii]PNW78229.1 hypothetical protein CHLRE_09g386751v5 [Chlamydomonas reinhardtii]